MRRIGVLTGGGDAPGLNAVIRAIVKRARAVISGILPRGGTILGTSNRDNPFAFNGEDRFEDCRKNAEDLGLTRLSPRRPRRWTSCTRRRSRTTG